MKNIFVVVSACLIFGACSSGSSSTVMLKGSGGAGLASRVFGASDPSSLTLKIYKFAVSRSEYCTNPVTVFENDSGVEVDFLDLPEIGSGAVANGAYPCVMFEFSDNITFVAASNDGDCTAGESNTIDVCRDNGSGTETVRLIDGTEFLCDNTNQRVAMYISTGSTSTGGGGEGGGSAFEPPSASDTQKGLPLDGEFEVSGESVATFVVDASDKIEDPDDDQPSSCDMAPPSFSFTAAAAAE